MAVKKGFKGLESKKKPGKLSGISEKVVRLLKIYTLIARNKYPSVQDLRDRFDVTERTIYRDLRTIDMIDPVVLDEDRHGYHFMNGDRIKKLVLSDEELMTLFTMGDAVSHLGTTFRENFQKIIRETASGAGMTGKHRKVPIIIRIPDAVQPEKIDGCFTLLSQCINERRSVDMIYRSRHAGETTERRVDPYNLVFHDGIWYLIGYCHLREDIRFFALDRIDDLKERWFYFEAKKDFDPEAYMARSWGIYDEEPVDVVVRFTPSVSDLIGRKEKWHPSEKRKVLGDGSLELTFTVAGIQEIKRWLYSWLPDVEVVRPPSLRKEIRKELAKAVKKHN